VRDLLAAYPRAEPRFDEMLGEDGRPRAHWAPLVDMLARAEPARMRDRIATIEREIRDSGLTYNMYADPKGAERPWALDALPMHGRPHRVRGAGEARPGAALAPRDRAAGHRIAAMVLRRAGSLDAVLEPLLRRAPPPTVRNALRIGSAELLLLATPAHAAVASAVDLVPAPFAGLVNAVLRKIATGGAALLEGLDAERLDIALPELGSFGMRYRLTGMTPDKLDTQDFSDLRLEAAQLRLTDAGFYRRLLADEARRSDQPEAKIRAGYLADVTGLLGGAKAAGPLLPPVQRFRRGEATTLELKVAPAQPVGLEALDQASKRGPAAVQRLLGLRLEAK
jgi:transcription termination factor NusB